MYEDKKIENSNNEYIAKFIDTMHCRVSPLCYTSNRKIFCLTPDAYSFAQFLYCKEPLTGTISASESFFIIGQFCGWNFLLEICN